MRGFGVLLKLNLFTEFGDKKIELVNTEEDTYRLSFEMGEDTYAFVDLSKKDTGELIHMLQMMKGIL